MQYKVIGSTMPAVEVLFDRAGESMYTQSGGMAWMSEGVEMNTNTNGGILKGVGRMFAGESMFMANYTAKAPGAMISLCRAGSESEYNLYEEIFCWIFRRRGIYPARHFRTGDGIPRD